MAALSVRILSRYILRQHAAPLGFSLAALTSLMILQQIARQFGQLVGKGLPAGVIADVFVLSLPFIIAMTLPMAVLVAVLYTMSHLAADHEITAMKAGGVSTGRMLLPVLAGAGGIALLALAWNDQVLPRANHSLRTLLVDIQRKKPSFTLKEEVINEVVPGQFFLRAARIDAATSKLRDVTIYDLGDADRRRIISADSGRMAYTPGGKDLYLTLLDGDIREVKRAEPEQFNRTFFRENRIRVAGVSNTFEQTENDTYKGTREMTLCEMQQVVAGARDEEARAHDAARAAVLSDLRRLAGLPPAPGDTLSARPQRPSLYCRLLGKFAGAILPDEADAQNPATRKQRSAPRARVTPRPDQLFPIPLRPPATPQAAGAPPIILTAGGTIAAAERVRSAKLRAAMYEVEIQKKYALAAACVVFALLGFPVAIRFPRGGIGLVIGMSVVVFAIYYVGLIGGEQAGDRMTLSPFWSMWAANVVCGVAGLIGLWAVRREGGTARGGDWDDIRATLLFWRRKRVT